MVEVQAGVVAGELTAKAKRPGGDWGVARTRQVLAGGHGSITLGAGSGELVVQLRFDGGGGRTGFADLYLGAGTDGVRYSALDAGSRLSVDGLGPVRIGMTLDEARTASGLPLVTTEGPYCRGYRSDSPPTGVALVAVEGSTTVDFITVSEPTIATVSGIWVGSSEAEVRRAYGGQAPGIGPGRVGQAGLPAGRRLFGWVRPEPAVQRRQGGRDVGRPAGGRRVRRPLRLTETGRQRRPLARRRLAAAIGTPPVSGGRLPGSGGRGCRAGRSRPRPSW